MAQADSLAQGRVWSGVDAQRVGLIDKLGNLEDAIAEAAQLADMKDFGIKKFPKYKTGIERLIEDLGGAGVKVRQNFIEEEIGTDAYSVIKQIKAALEKEGVQARMPFVLDIK